MIAIIDYGVGNVQSIQRALEKLGHVGQLVSQREDLEAASGIILPGVGAFDAAMDVLESGGLKTAITALSQGGLPVLGICLGMQILFESSEEGTRKGLGLLPGEVVHLPQGLRVPHLGWNWVQWKAPSGRHGHYYFAHSYYARTQEDKVLAYTDYGSTFPAVVTQDNLWGVQFHPEKSGLAGLDLLQAWIERRLGSCS